MSPKPALLTSSSIGRSGSAEPRLDLRQLLAVGEVGRQHLDLYAVLEPQLGGDLDQPRLVARHEHEIVAAGSQLVGERVTDPCGRPGDESSAQ